MSAIYIHGFNSSPQSFKARLVGEWFAAQGRAVEYAAPALPDSPQAAIILLETEISRLQQAGHSPVLIGSSLGGYYATYLSEKFGLKAVLINPAVRPYELLVDAVGPQKNYHTGETYEFTRQHLDELRALEVAALTPSHYLLLTASGDEVLDYLDGVERYHGARQIIIEGSDHGLPEFVEYLPQVIEFCDA
jgi:predicted esterase YcpF (UPF0227 family)